MEILSILTTGMTGMVFAILIVFMAINVVKSGYMGFISKWVEKAKDEKEKYGGRILFLGMVFSVVVNMVQRFAGIEEISVPMLILRIIGSSFMATGGYEYMKTIVKNLPDTKANE